MSQTKPRKMEYVMESAGEAARLERQVKLPNYSLDGELRGLSFEPGQRILDAGCGSGVLSRHLLRIHETLRIEGCDLSEPRLLQARELASGPLDRTIRFFRSSLDQIERPDATYDGVICRYVLQHLPEVRPTVVELARVTKPRGFVRVIEIDGILFNLHTAHAGLNAQLLKLRASWTTDLTVGRKVASYLAEAGLTGIEKDLALMEFNGADLTAEADMMRERLGYCMPKLIAVFGTADAPRFIDLYCDEMLKSSSTLFYTKVVVTAYRPSP